MFLGSSTYKLTLRLLCLFVLIYSLPSNAETTQANAQAQAELLHRKAADLAMQNSTTSAMTALMELGALNIPSAVTNGYKAYGSYRNSEELDLNADLNSYLQRKMQSTNSAFNGAVQNSDAKATAKSSGGITDFTVTDTNYSRLDKSFLRTGKAGEIAAEFERKTGMSRDDFVKHLALEANNKISPNDPRLVDKVVGRFESFVSKIPNQEFRANLEKGIGLIPQTARTGLMAQAIQKFSKMVGGDSSVAAASGSQAVEAIPNIETKPALAGTSTPTKVNEPKNEPKTEMAQNKDSERKPSSFDAVKNEGFFIAGDMDPNDPLANIIQSAVDSQNQEQTIFSQITRRYRLVTPELVPNSP